MKVMRNDVMSSEDSGDEGVNTITWRSAYADKMFNRIYAFCEASKTTHARRQTKR